MTQNPIPHQEQYLFDCYEQSSEVCKDNQANVTGRIITGDEIWVQFHYHESKAERHMKSEHQTNLKFSKSAGKVMAIENIQGIVPADFKSKGDANVRAIEIFKVVCKKL